VRCKDLKDKHVWKCRKNIMIKEIMKKIKYKKLWKQKDNKYDLDYKILQRLRKNNLKINTNKNWKYLLIDKEILFIKNHKQIY
jgi:hypothetical protein